MCIHQLPGMNPAAGVLGAEFLQWLDEHLQIGKVADHDGNGRLDRFAMGHQVGRQQGTNFRDGEEQVFEERGCEGSGPDLVITGPDTAKRVGIQLGNVHINPCAGRVKTGW